MSRLWCGLLAAACVSACTGGSSPSPLNPTATTGLASLVVSGSASLFAVGQTSQLQATAILRNGDVKDATGQVVWESANPAIVTTSASGLVTAIGFGVADIRAVYQGTIAAVSVLVTPPSSGASVRGLVQRFATGSPVPGAAVLFVADSRAGEASATADASGHYALSVPTVGFFSALVNGAPIGGVRVTGPSYRGDLFIDDGTCISRYGTLTDARTLNPVVGASVSLGGITTTSGPDGWYRIDLGCPPDGRLGFNTTFLYASHPSYLLRSAVVGRGIRGVLRRDLDLEPM